MMMPMEFPTGWTFERFQVELAELVGQTTHGATADGAAQPPTDAAELDRLKRAINRGYRLFLAASEWSFLVQNVSVALTADGLGPSNANKDPGIYVLPGFVSAPPIDGWVFSPGQNHCHMLEEIPVHEMLRMRAIPRTGTPAYSAHRKAAPQAGGVQSRHRLEFMVYPSPDVAQTVEASFRVYPPELVDGTDRTIAGEEHDLAILRCAHFAYESRDTGGALPSDLIADSLRLDRAARPKYFGTLRRYDAAETRAEEPRTILMNGEPI